MTTFSFCRWTIPLSHSNVEMVLILFIILQSQARSYRWLENDRKMWRRSESGRREAEFKCWWKIRRTRWIDLAWSLGIGQMPALRNVYHIDFNEWFLMDFGCRDMLVHFNLQLNLIISNNYSILSPKLAVKNKQQYVQSLPSQTQIV